ncbi:MAG TPA: hypothetical protein VFV54_11465 [Thermoanaerobaculia bacterium]|nr:hypothetical protein [Thermoanaerobaculia bacterium]
MRRASLVAGLLAIAGVALAQETIDFGERMTPRCEMAGLISVPPPGWINVPLESPPPGHHGCMMMRTNEKKELVGVLRIRSRSAPALDGKGEPFEALFTSEVASVGEMGYVMDEPPLWVRENVPINGEGFRDARGIGLAAMIEGNPTPQEVHLLVFRSDRAEYIVTLMTPAKSFDPKLYDRNVNDFGTLIRTLQPRE